LAEQASPKLAATRLWLPILPLLLLAFSLPFELDAPLYALGPLVITNLEFLLLLTLGATAVAQWRTQHPWQWPPRYWGWLVLFVAALLLSTALAPQLQSNAFKASLRLISGIMLALAVPQLVCRPAYGRAVALALLSGGLVAAAIGWWEISQSGLPWLTLFRDQITRVGAYFRLTGPFDYANQTAMFIEATMPFLVAAGWQIRHSRWPRHRQNMLLALLFLLTLGYLQVSILTLSRASFATIFLVCLLLAVALAYRQPPTQRQMARWWLALALCTAVLVAANALFSDQMRLRLQGGDTADWYRAEIEVPPTLQLDAGSTLTIPVTVTNQGALDWQSVGENPILLGARWINEAGTQAFGEPRWSFPHYVRPQEQVQMTIPLKAPPNAGVYELRWDVVQENVTWFGNKSGVWATSQVTVEPATIPLNEPEIAGSALSAWGYISPIPNRTTLWLLAVQMLRERPLLGIGMDNYRLTYGAPSGAPFNTSVHTNNFYLEMLVSLGLIGALPFLIWLLILSIDLLRTLRRPQPTIWQAATAAGLLAFLIHGLLDFFLLFNATGLLFWILVGLWSSKLAYAHRI
jgi:hypothetical protein